MNKEDFQIVWVDQPFTALQLKKYSRTKYTCACRTEKTSLPFRDWIEMKKERAPERNKGLFIYDILPTSIIKSEDGDIITQPSYLIRCDWINKINLG